MVSGDVFVALRKSLELEANRLMEELVSLFIKAQKKSRTRGNHSLIKLPVQLGRRQLHLYSLLALSPARKNKTFGPSDNVGQFATIMFDIGSRKQTTGHGSFSTIRHQILL